MRIGWPDHGRGSTGAEREGGELPHEVVAGGLRVIEPAHGGFLRGLRILAIDDHGVLDLAGVDHVRRKVDAVKETQAGVGDVKVYRRRWQTESMVDLYGHGRLKVFAAD